jgi:hypothetical protein
MELTINKKGYQRSSYKRKGYCYMKKGKRICVSPTKVKATKVSPTKYKIKDIGAKGKSKKPKGIPKLKKGRMSSEVKRILKKDIQPTNVTKTQWKKIFRKSKIPAKSWLGMFGTQIARRKYAKKGSPRYKNKMAFQKAINVLADVKEKALIPRKAIAKWKSLPPNVRARLMPERSKKNLKNVV